jgi:hypothetical protein
MAKMTITIEGETSEVRELLRKLASVTSADELHTSDEVGSFLEASDDAGGWTEDLIRVLWSRLKSNAKRILVEIAKHPEGIYLEEVDKRLGMDSRSRGGSLSSVGFAMNAIRKRRNKDLTWPFRLDRSDWKYKMNPIVAGFILELAGKPA